METVKWKKEWSAKTYEWPVTAIPDAATVALVGNRVIARGGRRDEEAHADRGEVMEFPNEAIPGTTIRKQVPKAECRRRAQVTLTDVPLAPLKVCVVCDAAHLWPGLAA